MNPRLTAISITILGVVLIISSAVVLKFPNFSNWFPVFLIGGGCLLWLGHQKVSRRLSRILKAHPHMAESWVESYRMWGEHVVPLMDRSDDRVGAVDHNVAGLAESM